MSEHTAALSYTQMGARLYDPTTGRFLEVDPIEGGSSNDYDYVTADPIGHHDLNGTIKCPKGSKVKYTANCNGGYPYCQTNNKRKLSYIGSTALSLSLKAETSGSAESRQLSRI